MLMNKTLRYSFVALMAMFMGSAFAQKEVVVDFNSMSVATSSGESDAGDINETYKIVADDDENVVILISPKAEEATNPNRFWQTNSGPQLRCYSGTITIQAKFAMKSITFDAPSKFDVTANVGKLSSTTWSGEATEVVFAVNKNSQINKITISGEAAGNTSGEEDHIANTAETAYTVAKAIELIDAGKALSEEVYVKGKISKLENYKDGSYTYWISDDGTTESSQFECYKGKGLDGADFTSADDMKKGATVIVKGKLKKYNSTYEFDAGNVLVSYDASTAVEEKHIANTEETAYTVAEAIALIDAGESLQDVVFVKGIVSQVDKFDDRYNSITYWISDDGTTTNQFECYSGKGIGGASFASIDDVQVGATVIVKGNMKKYNSIYEFDKNNELVKYDASTAGISNLKAKQVESAVYNLAGQRVDANYKGVVIKDGQKLIQK